MAVSLHLPPSFIEIAYQLRNKYYPETAGDLSLRTSSYNSLKIRGKCEICNGRSQDVHHIREQHSADKDGFFGRIHKNHVQNLKSVCRQCHDNIHHHDQK